MIEFREVFYLLQEFLSQSRNIGVIEDFKLVPLQVDEKSGPEFEKVLWEFAQGIDKLLVKEFSTQCSDDVNTEPSVEIKDNASKSAEEEDSESKDIDILSVDTEPNNEVSETNVNHLVQLQVDGTEIHRRINAFASRKRKEVDEWNVQEFCSRPYVEEHSPVWDQIESCARVDAVFVPRFGGKSHVKVSKVENQWGPQSHIRQSSSKDSDDSSSREQKELSLEVMQERIQNMESHLNIQFDGSIRRSIFQRLKMLESRILFLEGLSPDYFHFSANEYASPKKKSRIEKEKMYSNWSIKDILHRIESLRESLRLKSQEKNSESVHIKQELETVHIKQEPET